MADAKLTALTAASALAAADLFYVSQSAASRKATGTQLLTLVGTTYVPLAGGTMTGALTLPAGAVGAPALMFTGAGATTGLYSSGASNVSVAVGGVQQQYWTPNSCWIASTNSVGLLTETAYFTIGPSLATAPALYRDVGTNFTFAFRNGTNAQTLRVYGTYTDSSNYERLTLSTTAGSSVNIVAETLGTGSDNLDIVLTPAGMGSVYLPIGATATPGVRFVGTNAGLWYSGTFTVLRGQNAAINDFVVGNAVFRMNSTEVFGWASGDAVATAHDIALRRSAAGVLDVDSGSAGAYRDLKARNTIMPAVAFASLVAAATAGAGARSTINNCSTAVFNAAADGAGALTVPVWSNGTSWLVG